MTDRAIDLLSHNAKCLTTLDISGCSSVTNESLKSLADNSNQLTALNVSSTAVSHLNLEL